MLVEEARGDAHEISDMARPFSRCGATVMDDFHSGNICTSSHAVEAYAPVEILEIKEEARVEAAGRFDRLAAHEHERAAHGRNRRDRLIERDAIDQVAHFVTLQPLAEQSPQCTWRESAQRKIDHRGITLADILPRAVFAARCRRQHAYL